jgi:WD40 repeat protein
MASDRLFSSAALALLALSVAIMILTAQVPTPTVGGQAGEVDINTLGLLWENKDGHNATLWSVRWSPDGTMIAGTFFDDTVTVFSATDGKVIVKRGAHPLGPASRCWGSKDCPVADHRPLRTSSWSPDGKYLAVGGDSTDIVIYYTANWTEYKTLEGHRGSVLTLAWSGDGKLLASGSGTDKVDPHNMPENEIRIWNTTSWTTDAILKGHSDGVMNLRWSPNGTRLASASDDKTIRIWNTTTWKVDKVLAGHTLGALDVAWSPDGKTLASGSRDYKVMTWDYDTGKPLSRLTEANCIRSVDFHPSGKFYANSGVDEVQLKVRDTKTGSVLKSFTEGITTKSDIMSSRWSPDGKFLAAGAGKEHALRVYSFGHSGGNGGEKQLKKDLPGLAAFSVVVAVAIVLLYYPIARKLKEGGR